MARRTRSRSTTRTGPVDDDQPEPGRDSRRAARVRDGDARLRDRRRTRNRAAGRAADRARRSHAAAGRSRSADRTGPRRGDIGSGSRSHSPDHARPAPRRRHRPDGHAGQNLGDHAAEGAVVREIPQYRRRRPTRSRTCCRWPRPVAVARGAGRCVARWGRSIRAPTVTIRSRTRILVAAALHSSRGRVLADAGHEHHQPHCRAPTSRRSCRDRPRAHQRTADRTRGRAAQLPRVRDARAQVAGDRGSAVHPATGQLRPGQRPGTFKYRGLYCRDYGGPARSFGELPRHRVPVGGRAADRRRARDRGRRAARVPGVRGDPRRRPGGLPGGERPTAQAACWARSQAVDGARAAGARAGLDRGATNVTVWWRADLEDATDWRRAWTT